MEYLIIVLLILVSYYIYYNSVTQRMNRLLSKRKDGIYGNFRVSYKYLLYKGDTIMVLNEGNWDWVNVGLNLDINNICYGKQIPHETKLKLVSELKREMK